MKVTAGQVNTAGNKTSFGWVNLKLVPETEEEKALFLKISKYHADLIEEGNTWDDEIIYFGAVVTDTDSVEMEIIFPNQLHALVKKE
ncbi:MAG: hypothetical protein Q7S82_01875 [bacterium]|nr:hypothetical protein [bacterium]